MSDATSKSLLKSETKSQSAALAPSQSDVAVISVEALNAQIRRTLEGEIGTIWVQGEISNFKAHTSGHFYFSLKDQKAQVAAVMFRGSNAKLKFRPTDGLEVIVRGRITVYEPRGNYQLLCETMEPVGAGALQKAFEQLRDKLKQEGLFNPSRKRPIPAFPRHVAVVTSPTGAAIRDILNVLSRRAKSVKTTVVPTLVQGAGAAPQIVQSLKSAYRLPDVDVIILGRGGGSMEDLWAFNDETLARTIAESPVPVISAVGHEIDFTISDFVADLRAPTPSAAAELVAKSSSEILDRIRQMDRLLKLSLDRQLKTLLQNISGLSRRLIDPRKKLEDLALRNDDLLTRLDLAMMNRLSKRRQKLEPKQSLLEKALQLFLQKRRAKAERLQAMLDSLSPLKVVERGYAIVTRDEAVVKSASQVDIGTELRIRLAEGELVVTVKEKKKGP
ncbi:MAG: exodeoxyribonuclease VII large subunit [Bdellovibrionaceae bacterium]|nr:exodeoxyribonuclease VII large subunit [Pseudobdellovibrionaceae bacterium]